MKELKYTGQEILIISIEETKELDDWSSILEEKMVINNDATDKKWENLSNRKNRRR